MTERTDRISNSASNAARMAASMSTAAAPLLAATAARSVSQLVDALKQASPLEAGDLLRALDAATGGRAQTSALACGGGVPDFPAPPAARGTGDGSGPHGAATPTYSDRLVATAFFAGAKVFENAGSVNAADHMRHFLGNSGATLEIDPTRMLAEIPGFQAAVNSDFAANIMIAAETRARQEFTGQPMCFTIETPWQNVGADKLGTDLSSNWHYGVGTFSFSQTAQVSVKPGPNGAMEVSIDSQLRVFDRYNWDSGKAVAIAGQTITDEVLSRLHEVGLAQEYDIHGTMEQERYQHTMFD